MTPPATPIDSERAARLDQSIRMLEIRHPDLSARTTGGHGAMVIALVCLVAIVLGLAFATVGTLIVIAGVILALYLGALGYRVQLVNGTRDKGAVIRISDEEARAIADEDLPIYTILIPAYREPESVAQCLDAIEALEYPKDRLDTKLLLEEDDLRTVEAALARQASYVEVVLVPPAVPRTKPKALNYGLLGARGQFVTIFDVEDIPEPLQLRRAVAAFRQVSDDVACIQARLAFYNPRQNQITKWFTLDYAIWFDWFLPSLAQSGAVVPLGGTSNHFRRDALVEVGAWDPFNVTEDADLGVRLRRLGARIALLDSTTYEESTSEFMNWVKQRSRWYKGYLQTWLVHLRHPRELWRDLGPRGFLSFNFFIGGTPILAACNVVTWLLTVIWLAARAGWIHEMFPRVIYYPSLFCFVFGNFICIYMGMVSARKTDNSDLMLSAVGMPIYWLMMSLAALKAVVQLIVAPSFWEKTVHGMHQRPNLPPINVGQHAPPSVP